MSTLQEISTGALNRDPATPIIEYDKRWLTWGDLRKVADRMNSLIDASGADPRAPVALIPRNRPSALAALIGLTARGRSISMIHVYQSAAGIARDLDRLNPAVVIATSQDLSAELRSAIKARGMAAISLSEMDAEVVPGCERSTAASEPIPEPQIDMLTSGTTGPPKQFALSYAAITQHMVTGVNLMDTSKVADPLQMPPMILFYPFGNFSGLYATLPPIVLGIRGVLIDRFGLDLWLDYVRRYRPASAGLPTSALQTILEAKVPAADLASLKSIQSGASPLDPTVQRAFEDKYNIPILLAFGATEFIGPLCVMTADLYAEWGKKKLGSVGRAYYDAQLRIVDPDTDAVLPPNTVGVLEVKTPRSGQPGWVRTSDVALIDDDGFMWHKGRADGAIMRGGFKVLPDTIERALKLHPAVSAAGVTGVPDKRLGQVPAAAIQLVPGAPKPTIAELEQHLRDHVEAPHIPVHWRFVEKLPYTAMVKVDRAALRRIFEAVDAS
jgi:acyl-coenzyme A synthetase/AMP-(fatty) acid ligase